MKVKEKIMEAFANLIPENSRGVVEEAIENFIKETEGNIREEYEKTLEKSYEEWNQKLEEAKSEGDKKISETENTAFEGYQQAKEMLVEKEEEIIKQKNEYEGHIEREFNVAKKMIDEEKGRNETIEQELYEAYNNQLEDIKEDLVNKIDEFISGKIGELGEDVRKELKNDPEVLESKVAFERIKDIIASSMTSDDLNSSTASKIEELEETVSRLQAENKKTKARNMRLETFSLKTKDGEETINENTDNKKERALQKDSIRREAERRIAEKAARVAEGRGDVISREDIITEETAGKEQKKSDDSTTFVEGITREDLRKLSGFRD
jgi:hypothetical protein